MKKFIISLLLIIFATLTIGGETACKTPHTHAYVNRECTEKEHWDECACGAKINVAPHNIDTEDDAPNYCIDCQGYLVYSYDEMEDVFSWTNRTEVRFFLLQKLFIPISSQGQGSGYRNYAIGTEYVDKVIIEGNSYGIQFQVFDEDGNIVKLANPNATLVLNNTNIDSDDDKGNGEDYHNHHIDFDCNVSLNNVNAKRALSFRQKTTLNNVKITEEKDLYALWIVAGANVSINDTTVICEKGRGVKINDHKRTNPEPVRLELNNVKFTTAKKAAVMVSSFGKVEIIANNVNIKETVDSKNLAWLDEDWLTTDRSLITISGGTIIDEVS